jgi:hypothetical protein
VRCNGRPGLNSECAPGPFISLVGEGTLRLGFARRITLRTCERGDSRQGRYPQPIRNQLNPFPQLDSSNGRKQTDLENDLTKGRCACRESAPPATTGTGRRGRLAVAAPKKPSRVWGISLRCVLRAGVRSMFTDVRSAARALKGSVGTAVVYSSFPQPITEGWTMAVPVATLCNACVASLKRQ